MSHRFLIGICVAFFAVLAFGVAAVVGVTAMSESQGTPSPMAASAPVVATADPTPAAAPALQPRVAADPTPRAPQSRVAKCRARYRGSRAKFRYRPTRGCGEIGNDEFRRGQQGGLGARDSRRAEVAQWPLRLRPAQLAETFCANWKRGNQRFRKLLPVGPAPGDSAAQRRRSRHGQDRHEAVVFDRERRRAFRADAASFFFASSVQMNG